MYSFNLCQCVVHCENGGNKSISAVIAYLIKYQTKRFEQALSYVKNKMKIVRILFILD